MSQSEYVYVIRHLSYWYTDEWYQPCLDLNDHVGKISGLFHNKEQATAEWKQLEYQFSHSVNFSNILYAEYSDDRYHGYTEQLAQKSADELFALIQESNGHVYGLYEYPATLKQQVFFDSEQQCYRSVEFCTEEDIETNAFIEANFIDNDPLLTQVTPSIQDTQIHCISHTGSLDELSHTPLLLKSLLEHDPDFKVCGDTIEIKANGIAKINPLLKNPIPLEVRYLSLEEIYQQQLAQY